MEPFGEADKCPVRVQIGIGMAFLAFGLLLIALMVLDIGEEGGGLWSAPLFSFVAGGIILWRANGRVRRGGEWAGCASGWPMMLMRCRSRRLHPGMAQRHFELTTRR